MNTKRYYIIDYIRVFVIINMILYHALWDMVHIFHSDYMWFKGSFCHIWQRIICITFIFISGFCWSISRNHLKRGIYILICSFIITAVTAVFMPESKVMFGILVLIGSSVIIMIPLEGLLKYINKFAGLILSVLLYIFFYNINKGYILFDIKVPDYLYNGSFMTYMGFMDKNFYSSDYFSIIPWIFIFFSGYFAFGIFSEKNMLYLLEGKPNKIVMGISRKSLLIYLIHQPIVYGILTLIYHK